MKIAFINGIHEDVVSLEKALKHIDKLGVNKLICLGDIVGYSVPYYGFFQSRDANKCVKLVDKYCDYIVLGNHDLYALKRTPNSPIFDKFPNNWYDLNYYDRIKFSNNKICLYENDELSALLDDNSKSILSKFDEELIINIEGSEVLLSHFIYPDITGETKNNSLEQISIRKNYLKDLINRNCKKGFFAHLLISGLGIINNDHYVKMNFNKQYQISNNDVSGYHSSWISRGTEQNGFMVWDTENKTIVTHSLGDDKHKIPQCYLR